MERKNLIYTFILWVALGIPTFVLSVVVASRKTVVIAETAPNSISETAAEELEKHDMRLSTDPNMDNEIYIPLFKGVKAENVTIENHYFEKTILIYVKGMNGESMEEKRITGDLSGISDAYYKVTDEALIYTLYTGDVFEVETSLEDDRMLLRYGAPHDMFDFVLVCAGDGEVAANVEKKLLAISKDESIRIYCPDADGENATDDRILELINGTGADAFVDIRTLADPDTGKYGMVGFYNESFFIPYFSNVDLADAVTRNVAVECSNRALNLNAAEEGDILKKVEIPAAGIGVGFLSNSDEAELLQQDAYLEKIAVGIYKGILEMKDGRK
ncbi:MAG: N-acetylmuramoyl-L-alanine amidase [Acetatifactor sp.]|nr:N-acetylmuramoyl-L-alanine amidase [Acetatifactor sp.]